MYVTGGFCSDSNGRLRSNVQRIGMLPVPGAQRLRLLTSKMTCTSVLLTAICLAVYWNALYCGFVFDDISAIKENKDLRPHTPLRNLFENDFWGTPITKEQSHKSYRPLCVLTFRWNYWVHQLEPWGYHLANILLHAAVTCLFSRMCSLFLKPASTFAAALLFAVHPIHTEAVTGVVGRAELLSSFFSLAAFLLYTRCRGKSSTNWVLFGAALSLICISMLCKEQGITVIGICVAYELFVVQKVRLRDFIPAGSKSHQPSPWIRDAGARLLCLTASVIGLLLVRMQVMGAQLPIFTRFDNPASVSETPTRQLTYNYLVSWNALLLTFPSPLCCDWTMGTIPLVETFNDPRNLGTLLFYIILALLTTKALASLEPVLIMGLAWSVLPFLPASNLFFPVGFVIAERVLYTPSMGFCMLVAYGFSKLEENRQLRAVSRAAFVFTLLIFAAKTHVRNWDWETEETVFASGLRVNQRNAKLFNNVGHALESQKRYNEALEYFVQAVRVQEDDVGAHINVGRTYTNLGLLQEAEDAYLKAKSLLPRAKPGESYQTRIAPNHLNVFLNLAGLVARNATRLSEADALYRQAISMRADYTQAYINRGDVLLKMNRTKEAQEVYEKALFYDSHNPDIYYNLGVVLLEQDKPGQALAYFEKALELEPEHQAALLNSGIILQELASVAFPSPDATEEQIVTIRKETLLRRQEAQRRLMKLLALDQKNDRAFFHLGMIATDLGDISGAERWFRAAIELKPDFRSALFNLALLLADHGRPLEAAPFLRQLVRHHPDHVKGLVLLGDIYVNTLRDLDAAETSYRRILEIDPENVQGLHNLCVVHVERGHLLQAEKCLEQARSLAPKEEYISRHLSIVKERIARQQKVQPDNRNPVRT